MSVQLDKKKYKELLEFKRKYLALEKTAKKQETVKKILEKNERNRQLKNKVSNILRKNTLFTKAINKTSDIYKQTSDIYKQNLPPFIKIGNYYENSVATYKASNKYVPTSDDPQIFL